MKKQVSRWSSREKRALRQELGQARAESDRWQRRCRDLMQKPPVAIIDGEPIDVCRVFVTEISTAGGPGQLREMGMVATGPFPPVGLGEYILIPASTP